MKKPSKKTLKRVGLYGLLGIVASATLALLFLLYYTPKPFEVTCSGNADEMGRQYGEKLGMPMRLLIRRYLERIVCMGNSETIERRYAAAAQLLENLEPRYETELRATADAAGCWVNGLAYGNCFLDIGNARAGCRSVVIESGDALLHAHNLDWDNLGGLARWTTCIIRRNPNDGRLRTVTIAFPGIMGSLDVINEKGVALSFNQLGRGNSIPLEPVFITMRRIAETCETFAGARKEIMTCPPGMPFLITLSSATERKAAVFERTRDTVQERVLRDGWVGCCNVAQGQEVGNTPLDRAVTDVNPTDLTSLMQVLRSPGVIVDANLYSVIFDHANNRLFLASGKLPAAAQPYREYPLF